MNYEKRLTALIESDPVRMSVLEAVRSIALPDCFVAAGFVRTLVWNELYQTSIELDDVDVIYYCESDVGPERDRAIERQLENLNPAVPWSVKNQARMHGKAGHRQYGSAFNAMAHWPEKQTAVGVALDQNSQIVISHCFELAYLFNGEITYNPASSLKAFDSRVATKRWLEFWPQLTVVRDEHIDH